MSKKDRSGFPWKKPEAVPLPHVGPSPEAVPLPHVGPSPEVVPLAQQVEANVTTEVLPAGDAFLALAVVKVGPTWHKVEVECELVGEKARAIETRLGEACTRVQAIAEFKLTAVRKGVTA